MKARVRQVGQVAIVDIEGKITIGEGDMVLRDRVVDLLDKGSHAIVLNLEKVTYMDSAGIGELVACYKRAKEKGGTVKLLYRCGMVLDLLTLTKLEEVFETYRQEQEAVGSF